MRGPISRLGRFYRPYLSFLIWGLVCLVFATALSLAYPYLLKQIINVVVLGHNYNKLPLYVGAILAAALLKGFFNFGQSYLSQLFGSHTAFDLRNRLYEKLNHQSFSYYDDVHSGDLMSRMTADLDAFRMYLAFGINSLVNLVLIVVFGLGLMFSINAVLGIVIACLMPILAVTAVLFDRRLRPTFTEIRKSLGTLNSGVQENVMGMRTVKSFAQEEKEVEKFQRRNQTYFSANMDATRLWKKFFPFIELVGNLGVVLILVIGGLLVIHHQHMNLGDLVAFLSVVWTIIWPMAQLGWMLNNYTQAQASGERLLEILDVDIKIENVEAAYNGEMQGRIKFDHVTVSYHGRPVIKDFNLTVEPGETIALLGLTGSGKTTLMNLIPRFYDAKQGSIEIDGVDVRHWELASLRRQVAIAFQEPFLFSTTIFSNIAYGAPDATLEAVRLAAEMADAAEFIDELPDGYNTLVGERGMGLSGGQKQRIALARAILMNPKILVLDDATSAVDMETEYEIQEALGRVMKGRTTFIIAHRISSLKRADRILVIEEGKIVEHGCHDELMNQHGLYRRIFDMQFKDFERVLQADGSGYGGQKITGGGNIS